MWKLSLKFFLGYVLDSLGHITGSDAIPACMTKNFNKGALSSRGLSDQLKQGGRAPTRSSSWHFSAWRLSHFPSRTIQIFTARISTEELHHLSSSTESFCDNKPSFGCKGMLIASPKSMLIALKVGDQRKDPRCPEPWDRFRIGPPSCIRKTPNRSSRTLPEVKRSYRSCREDNAPAGYPYHKFC